MPLSSFKSGNSEINFRLERKQGAWLTSYHRTNSRKGVNFPKLVTVNKVSQPF